LNIINSKALVFTLVGVFIGVLIGASTTFIFIKNQLNDGFSYYIWQSGVTNSQRALKILHYLEDGEIEKAKWKAEDILLGETGVLESCLDDICSEYGSTFMIESIEKTVIENNKWIETKGIYSNKEETERYRKYFNSLDNKYDGPYSSDFFDNTRKLLNEYHNQKSNAK